jgi:hypothetical protein
MQVLLPFLLLLTLLNQVLLDEVNWERRTTRRHCCNLHRCRMYCTVDYDSSSPNTHLLASMTDGCERIARKGFTVSKLDIRNRRGVKQEESVIFV